MNLLSGDLNIPNAILPTRIPVTVEMKMAGMVDVSPYSQPLNETYSKELQMNEQQRREWRNDINHKQAELNELAQAYKKLFPEFQWESASQVTWSEIIEHNGSKEPGKDSGMYAGELNQWIYWSNQCDARKIMLEMFAKILNNALDVVRFKEVLSQIHRELILGNNGQRVYWPRWMQGGGDHPRRIAGILRREDQEAADLLESLRKYLQEDGVDPKTKFTYLATFFRDFLQPYYAFSYGNTSMSIGIVNAALKLGKYNSINHADVGQYDSVTKISQVIENQN